MGKENPERTAAEKLTDGEQTRSANSTDTDELREQNQHEALFIVGLGASAGGLESFERFFTNMPPDSGMAFVVIVHLDPQHKTLLPELLGRYTRMDVLLAEEGMAVEPNRVYIIPANRDMTIAAGQLHLDEQLKPRGARHTIDYFLRSLAEDNAEHAAAVILSGTGSDGTQGVKLIKQAGGIVIVEEEQSAKYSGMPQSAIASGAADLILSAEQIGEKLIELSNRRWQARHKGQQPEEEIAKHLKSICRVVSQATGHDFGAYKANTMVRRINRRMAINNLADVADYIALLKENPEECKGLLREVLIGVTSFFRNPDAFDVLESDVIPKLFADRKPDDTIRIWLAGCATGEEAYSVAILLREYQRENRQECKVQIFASDLDSEAIEVARAGFYPEGISVDLTESRLKNFFRKVGDRYEVAKSLREMIVFAPHNLIKDPPFSRLDLLICRNLLIYLNPDIQKRLLPLFYQAIRPGGFLFLGNSETVGSHTDLFRPINKKWKIFVRREAGRRIGFELPVSVPSQGDTTDEQKKPEFAGNSQPKPGQVAEQLLVQRYSPPCVVINDKHEVLYYSTRTARFLEHPVGEPTQDILRMAHEDLRPALRAAIHKAHASQSSVVYNDLRVQTDEGTDLVRLIVEPITRPTTFKGLALVIFETTEQRSVQIDKPTSPSRRIEGDEKDQIIEQLEEQLRITHEELQTTIERLESSNEELKSSNEELMSMNEEFQSTNEELETSKEELQALNEELVTVNAELESKIEELAQTNDDLQNLLTSSEIATIFLDRELRVKRYTPRIAELFNLIDADIGRPLQHIAGKVVYPELAEDAEQVLDKLAPIERELSTADKKYYLLRMLPYRTMTDQIDGVVATLTDISSRRQAEEYQAQLAAIVDASSNAVFRCALDGTISSWNTGAENHFGYPADEMIGTDVERLVCADSRKALGAAFEKLRMGQNVRKLQLEGQNKADKVRQFEFSLSPIFDSAKQSVATAIIARDITASQLQQQKLAESERLQRARAAELEALMESVPAAVWIASDKDCKQITGNRAAYQLLHQSRGANLSKSAPTEDAPANFKVFQNGRELAPEELPMQRAARIGKPVMDFEEEILYEDGTKTTAIGNAVPLFAENGKVSGAVAAFIDISKLKQAEAELLAAKQAAEQANQAKSDFLGNVSHEVRTPLTGLMSMLDLLKETELNEEQQRLHSLAVRSTETLLDVIDDILDFARIEAGKLSIEPEPFALRTWAEEQFNHFEAKYQHKPIEFKLSIDDSLPELVVNDSKRVGQVLSNLLDNACKFTEQGEVEVTLTATQEQPEGGDRILIETAVRDTGIGITPDDQEKLFESFSQLDSSLSRKYGGSGLGLSIVQKLLELLDGEIEVSSKKGEGSTFTFRLPFALVPPQNETGQQGETTDPGNEKRTKPLSILIVDDDQIITEGLQKLLRKFNWQVKTADSGRAAVEAAKEQSFELIFMDVQMPVMNGLETTQEIKRLLQHNCPPIIGLTAHGRQEDKDKCLAAGMSSVLVKPVKDAVIKKVVEGVLREEH